MANPQDPSRPAPRRRWTGIDAYLRPLRRRSAARRRLSARLDPHDEDRSELLATLPFVALALALALFTLVIVSLAWPGQYRARPQAKAEAPVPGTAPPGWIDGRALRPR